MTVCHSLCLITMHGVSVESRRLSLLSLLLGRGIDYQEGGRRTAGAQTQELQAGHSSMFISLSLETVKLNLEHGSD